MEVLGEKLLIKLWDTLADKGIGSLLKPWQIKREGRATMEIRRQELLELAQAEVDAFAIRSGRKQLLQDGSLSSQRGDGEISVFHSGASENLLLSKVEEIADRNQRAESIRREISLSKSVLHAEEVLSQDSQEPPSTTISDGWLLRWRDCAASINTEELQSLWGKVLAGELKKPGRFSLRTLEFLRNLSQEEAKAIEKVSPFVINNMIFRAGGELLESEGVTFSLLLSLQELGIISGVNDNGIEVIWPSLEHEHFLYSMVSYGRALVVKHDDSARTIKVPVYPVTALGKQIFRLGSFKANDEYLKTLGRRIKDQGFDVQIGDFHSKSGNKITLSNMQQL